MNHPSVKHPRDLLLEIQDCQHWTERLSDLLLDWVTDHLLASRVIFYIALIVPLLVLRMSDSVKLTIGVISGSWFQWWALPALQRRQNRLERLAEAKADADHEALIYIANCVDQLMVHAGLKADNDLTAIVPSETEERMNRNENADYADAPAADAGLVCRDRGRADEMALR